MKHLFFLLLFSQWAFSFAQKGLPSFSKIDKSDLQMTECEFDKDAEAYKLISYGDVHYDIIGDDFNIITEKRIRIKILKEKGKDLANIKIRYYNRINYESIYNISGHTFNLDNAGNITVSKLEKSSIYDKKINNRVSEISFSLPDVKVGSIIEYKFTDRRRTLGGIDDWYFQEEIPTRYSSYRILVPSILRFAYQVMAYQGVKQTSENKNESAFYQRQTINFVSTERSFTLENVPAFRDEPYMGAEKDYMQRVEFQLTGITYNGITEDLRSTWPKIIKELLEDDDFGLQLKKNIPKTAALDDALKNKKDDYAKMITVHDYVRKNMNWDGRESIYSFEGIKAAWDKKSGNNSELNFILIDLLRDAGLDAYPILVSTKDNGTVNTLNPFIQQFNCVMTFVIIGEKKYVLNAADKYNPANLIPYDVVGNEVLIVDSNFGGWTKLENGKQSWRNVVTYFAQISPDANMEGKATVYNYEYSKNPRVRDWQENKSSFKDAFTKDLAAIKVNNLDVENDANDTLPLKQKFDFTFPLGSSGEYKYFTLNLFLGLDKNPFIADKRTTDIEFNYKQNYSLVGKVNLPEDYEFEELPKNIKLMMPDSSVVLRRLIQSSGNSIDFRVTLDFLKDNYPASSYPYLQEFYKKLFSSLNEQIVIKKKKTNA